jgi:hypothetical protein
MSTSSNAAREGGHRHERQCYWDHLRCGWVCPPAAPSETLTRPADAQADDTGTEPVRVMESASGSSL